jgi:hypothetical protein
MLELEKQDFHNPILDRTVFHLEISNVRCSAIEGILHRYHRCGPIFRFGVSRKR